MSEDDAAQVDALKQDATAQDSARKRVWEETLEPRLTDTTGRLVAAQFVIMLVHLAVSAIASLHPHRAPHADEILTDLLRPLPLWLAQRAPTWVQWINEHVQHALDGAVLLLIVAAVAGPRVLSLLDWRDRHRAH